MELFGKDFKCRNFFLFSQTNILEYLNDCYLKAKDEQQNPLNVSEIA